MILTREGCLLDGESIDADISLLGRNGHEFLSLLLEGLLGSTCGTLLRDEFVLVGGTVGLGLLGHPTFVGSNDVELFEGRNTLQWVGLGRVQLRLRLCRGQDRLGFVTVDETGKVGICHGSSGDTLSIFTVDLVQGLECSLGPDTEPSHMSTGGQLEQVQTVDTAKLDTWQVTEGLFDTVIGLIDNEWSTAHGMTAVTHLTLTGTDLLGITSLLDIIKGTNRRKKVLGGRCFGGRFDSIINNQWNLRDFIDDMSACHD
mmetsp:Transcript_49813/g.120722  ORF Transcript_49813/g.120722 Transcript_49813/m.120722 type:complete len:258 (-) Transcript_49813:472-1245(-)